MKIVEIINMWDPVGMFPDAPEDEYSIEIKMIEKFIKSYGCEIDKLILGEEIWRIFNQMFGGTVFKKNKESCVQIAEKIIGLNNLENLNL